MSVEVKIFIALAPICLLAMGYALIQGDWWTAGLFALLGTVMVVLYRSERRFSRGGSSRS